MNTVEEPILDLANDDEDETFDYLNYTDSQLPESPPIECEEMDLGLIEEPSSQIRRCDERFELLLPCNGGSDPRFSKTAWDRLVVLDTCSPYDYGEDLMGELDWQTQKWESAEETPRRPNDSEWDNYYMQRNVVQAKDISSPPSILFPEDEGYKKAPPEQPPYGRYGPLNMENFVRFPYGLDCPNSDTIL